MFHSKCHAERCTARDTFTRDTDQHCVAEERRLRAELAKVEQAAERAKADAHRAFEARRLELEEALARDFVQTLLPLAQQAFEEGPRKYAVAFAAAFCDLDARAKYELAAEIDTRAIVAVFAVAQNVADKIGDPDFMLFNGLHKTPVAADELAKACRAGLPAPVLDSRIRAVEEALAVEAAGARSSERAAVFVKRVTSYGIVKMLETFDAERDEADRKRGIASATVTANELAAERERARRQRLLLPDEPRVQKPARADLTAGETMLPPDGSVLI